MIVIPNDLVIFTLGTYSVTVKISINYLFLLDK